MTVLQNSFLTFSAVGNREDLADQIYRISPVDCPFMSKVGKNKATGVLHEWQSQALAAAASNAQLEGDDSSTAGFFGAVTATTRLSNRCQISRKTVVVSGTQDAVNKAGRNKEIVYQLTLKGQELRRDMEYVLIHNNNTAPNAGNSTTARVHRSLIEWLTTNVDRGAGGASGSTTTAVTDGTQRALTDTLALNVLQACWTAGGEVDIILVGPHNKRVVSAFTGNATRTIDTANAKLSTNIDIIRTDFGLQNIVADRFTRDRDALFIDSSRLAVSYLRPVQTIDLAKTGDAEKGFVLAEYCLEVRNEDACGVVADILTT